MYFMTQFYRFDKLVFLIKFTTLQTIQLAEMEHAAIQIPNEDSARTYFNLRQQLSKLQKEITEYIHKPRFVLLSCLYMNTYSSLKEKF